MNTKHPRWEAYSSIALILLTCTLAFGIQMWNFGFYWDDLASLHVYLNDGAGAFAEWRAGQPRPLTGLLSGWMWEYVGVNVLGWQVLHFALYLVSVLLFWRILRLLYPNGRVQTTLTALLFAVYPSYHLRPIPISFELITSLVLALTSFWLALVAAKRRNWVLLLFSAALIPVYQGAYEQNIGYELLRPLLIVYLLSASQDERGIVAGLRQPSQRRRILMYTLPGLLVTAAIVVWRFFIFEPSPTYAAYNQFLYLDSPSGWMRMLALSVAAPVRMLALDWGYMPWAVFVREGSDIDRPALLTFLLMPFALLYLWRFPEYRMASRKAAVTAALIGLPLMAILLFSVHSVGRVLSPGFDSRFALTPSLLAAVIVGLGVPRLARSPIIGQWLLVGLILVGMLVQTGVNQEYIQDWRLRREVGWQMLWRAPELAPGTTVTILMPNEALAFDRVLGDYEIMGIATLYYYRESNSYPVVGAGDARGLRALLMSGRPLQGVWSERIFKRWEYDLSRLVVFAYDGDGCLKTPDPSLTHQAMPGDAFASFARYHHPETITDTPLEDVPAPIYDEVIAPEPTHGWCYHYQRMVWANQHGDFESAAQWGDAALTAGFAPHENYPVEWTPLIQAYNALGRYEDAQGLIYTVSFGQAYAREHLCEVLGNQVAAGVNREAVAGQADLLAGCSLP